MCKFYDDFDMTPQSDEQEDLDEINELLKQAAIEDGTYVNPVSPEEEDEVPSIGEIPY